jgi:hypothetical protein
VTDYLHELMHVEDARHATRRLVPKIVKVQVSEEARGSRATRCRSVSQGLLSATTHGARDIADIKGTAIVD